MRLIVGRVLLGAALVASAAGCDWAMLRGDAARSGNAVETTIGVGNVADLEQVWVMAIGTQARGPVTAGGAVVVTDADSVRGYEAATGALRFDTPLPPFIDPTFGSRQWTGPTAKAGTVYVGYGDPLTSGGSSGGFVTVDPRTGVVSGGGGCCGGGGAVPTSDVAFVGDDLWFPVAYVAPLAGGGLAGIEGRLADGTVVRALTDIGGSGAFAGLPAVAGDMAYFTRPFGGFIDAVDAHGVEGCGGFTCQPLWSAPVQGHPAIAASSSAVYASSPSGIAAYATGPTVRGPGQQPQWTAAAPGASAVALTPAGAPTSVLVGADDGTLRAFPAGGCGAATCAPTWQASTGTGDLAAPVIANGVAFVASSDGHVYAFAAAGCGAATCAPLWSTATPGTPSGVIVANGRVIVTTSTGNLAAYELPA